MTDRLRDSANKLRGALKRRGKNLTVTLTLPRDTASTLLELIEADQRHATLLMGMRHTMSESEAAILLGVPFDRVAELVATGVLAAGDGLLLRVTTESIVSYQDAEKQRRYEAGVAYARISNEAGFVD